MNEDLLNFLLNQTEHEGLDFKKGLYAKQNYEDLLKDVLAMANAKIQEPRYILFVDLATKKCIKWTLILTPLANTILLNF